MRLRRLLDLARPRSTLPPQMAYELWAATYPPAAHNALMRVEQEVVERLLRSLRAARALDVGTGTGRYLPALAATGATIVLGLDLSPAMLARCRADFRARGTIVRLCADACHLPLEAEAFDVINASLMVGDVADLDGWARELARVLKPGGHLIYSDFHPAWIRHGWRRTFHGPDGRAHDVALRAHTIEEHLSALTAAALRVVSIHEPRIDNKSDRAVQAFRRRWGNPPVVVVFKVVKDWGPHPHVAPASR